MSESRYSSLSRVAFGESENGKTATEPSGMAILFAGISFLNWICLKACEVWLEAVLAPGLISSRRTAGLSVPIAVCFPSEVPGAYSSLLASASLAQPSVRSIKAAVLRVASRTARGGYRGV